MWNLSISIMAKATSKKRNSRADPITRKADNPNTEEKTKQDHLYTDDNRETGLHGTGFKDAATADKTGEYFVTRVLNRWNCDVVYIRSEWAAGT